LLKPLILLKGGLELVMKFVSDARKLTAEFKF